MSLSRPLPLSVHPVHPRTLKVAQVDCYTIQVPELETITSAYKLTSMLQAPLHGFEFWFVVSSLMDQFARKLRSKQASQPL